MIRRLLAFALIAMLGTGAAHAAAACEDNWGITTEPACAVKALKDLHERQFAAVGKANNVLFDAISGILTAALPISRMRSACWRRPRHLSCVTAPGTVCIPGLHPKHFVLDAPQFHLQGWPEPADVPAGFGFLQTRLREPLGPERKAIVTAALRSWRSMAQSYESWISKWSFTAHRKNARTTSRPKPPLARRHSKAALTRSA